MIKSQAQWTGTPSIKGSTESLRMAMLTFSLIGLQFTWGVEMTYCTPYLLQLGLTKANLSLVWIAGPLSGLIMQPVVGIMADKSRSKYGRRRPVMIVGSVVVAFCLLVLGFTGEIIGLFASDAETKREWSIVLAVLSIYALDFAINAVQSSCRSLIVDTLPIPQQQLGSAWASRMIAIGHLVVYGIGALDLSLVFGGFLGDSQFKQLTILAAIALIAAVGVTSWAVKERILISDGREEGQDNAIVSTLSTMYHTTRNLPPRIQTICNIQFWSWIGWFPFLFYSSTWVGETYLRYSAPESVRQSPDHLSIIGRIGSTTLIVFSVVTFIASVSLPWLVRSPTDTQTGKRFTPRPPAFLKPFVSFLPHSKPDLLTAWTAGHLIFSATMIFAPFVASLHGAAVIVAISGIPWALASWAPFTYMGVEINRVPNPSRLGDVDEEDGSFDDDIDVNNRSPDATVLHLRQESLSSNAPSLASLGSRPASKAPVVSQQTGELAGVYLGILNLYTTLPQFAATGISAVVFAIFEPGEKGEQSADGGVAEGGVNAIAVCLFIGALCSLVAAWCTARFAGVYRL